MNQNHDPLCLYPAHPCDCGYKEPDWRDQFDKLYFNFKKSPDMAHQIKLFIEQLLIKNRK